MPPNPHLLRIAGLGLILVGVLGAAGCGAAGGAGGGTSGGGGNGTNGNPDGSIGPLTADAGPAERMVSLESGRVALVTLDASGSASPNGEIVSYEWSDGWAGLDCEIATGVTAEVPLGIGEHPITLTVTDGTAATARTDVVVTVVDNRPPEFDLAVAVQGAGRTDPPAATTTSLTRDSTATVTAIPEPGWQFMHWIGDSEATTATTTVVMDADKSLTAVFEETSPDGLPRFFLPWGRGETKTIGQANDGEFSHQERFAWDVPADIGTPVLAVAAGRVIKVVDQLPNNPPGVAGSPTDPANTVQIDHGNGFQSLYAHLDQFGTVVLPGQVVAAGQYLGRSGNSGYGTGPHLHYEVLDAANRSTSTGFHESLREGGVAREGDTITSQNELDDVSPADYVESALLLDAFQENNIGLFDPTPPAFFYTAGQSYSVRGRLLDAATNVCVALVDPESDDADDATVYCELQHVGLDRTFEIDFVFPESLTGAYLLGIVSGVAGVSGTAPVNVWITSPPPDNQPPVVTAAQPVTNLIDFGGSGVLRGSGSDPDGDTLTYLWAQTSGPPATIAEPSSPETTFTLAVGKGPSRVAFQLIAYDGLEASLPVQVEYRMPDNFHVRQIGVTDQQCADLAGCQAATTGGTLQADRKRVTIWADLLNVNAGDTSAFEVRSPSGELALSGHFCEPAPDSSAASFWQFTWSRSGDGGPLEAGQWQAVYLRNGVAEASASFTVTP
ncbi:MAG: peptidoglycan DD-metalloendopeptidase family protein [Planctomycetota bacterium]